MNPSRSHRGFAVVAAIFLLVILAALGGYMVSVSTSQHRGLALDVEGERAFQAANAGMDWARFNVAASSATPACAAAPAWGAPSSISFPGTATLASYVATVQCRLQQATDVSNVATSVYEVRVTACNRPQASEPRCPGSAASVTGLGYVERQMEGLLGL